MKPTSLFGCALLFVGLSFGEDVSLQVRAPVQPASIGGRPVLVYELVISNGGKSAVELKKVLITDDAGAVRLIYDGATLERNAMLIGPKRGKLEQLSSSSRAVVFVWIEAGSPVRSLTNQVFVSGQESPLTLVSPVAVDSSPVLGPPLEPGDWFIGNGPSNTSEHRRAQVRKDGDPSAPFAQRYAIDFGRICDGQFFRNDGKANFDYCGWGSKVLAVASGQVISAHDGVPENLPGSLAVKMDKDTLMGNHVILDIGGGQWALYAHLKPGTLLVKQGDHVQAGQEIGRVGNTGSSDAPHLHFHVLKAGVLEDAMLAQTDPVPYVFRSFQNIGTYGRGGLKAAFSEPLERSLPTPGTVIRFK